MDYTDNDNPLAEPHSSAAKLARQLEANDLKWLMSNKQGRRVIWRILEKAGIYRISFTGNSQTFFNEGVRSMGLFLVEQIHIHAPETYVLMTNEARENQA